MKRTTEKERRLRQRAVECWNQMKGILDAAEAAGKDFTRAQEEDWNRLSREIDQITETFGDSPLVLAASDEIDRRERVDALTRYFESVDRDPIVIPGGDPAFDPEARLVGPKEKVSDWVKARRSGYPESDRPLSIGKLFRGLAIGDWTDAAEEQRVLGGGAVGTGGALVPEILAAELVDKARSRTVVIQAGARTFPMETDKAKLAQLVGDPTAAWKTENAAVAESDLTFARIELDAETALVLVRASREVVEDAENLQDVITETFSKVLALKLDYAALRGTGVAPEPGPGIRNASGVNLISAGVAGGALTTDLLVDAVTAIRTDNHEDPNALVWHPRTAGAIAKLKDLDNNPIELPQELKDLGKFTTTAIPTNLTAGAGTNLTEVYVGKWDELIIGIRTQIAVEILRERYAESFQYGFLGYVRADVAPLRADAFTVITDVSS